MRRRPARSPPLPMTWSSMTAPSNNLCRQEDSHEAKPEFTVPATGRISERLVGAAPVARRDRPTPTPPRARCRGRCGRAWKRPTGSAPASAPIARSAARSSIYAKNGKVIHVEGDPRSPINQGTLCPKGAATFGWLTQPNRASTTVQVPRAALRSLGREAARLGDGPHRAAGQADARRDVRATTLPDGTTVNHTLGIAALGGATLDNEENYLIKKLFGGGLGMVWIENQARI